jgi:hypothetical protein
MTLAFETYGKSRHFQTPQTPILGRELVSRLYCSSLSVRPVDLLASLVGADQGCPQPTEAFTSGLSTDWSPAPPPDITTVATGQVPPAGFTPARTTTNIAAPVRRVFPVRLQGQTFRRGLASTLVCQSPFVLSAAIGIPCFVSGTMRLSTPSCERAKPLYPRGPRSGPGYFVPVHPHLLAHPPHSRATRRPTTGSELSLISFATCRLLRPRGTFRLPASLVPFLFSHLGPFPIGWQWLQVRIERVGGFVPVLGSQRNRS